jgi:transposase
MNTITDLLDLEDSDLFVSDVLVEGTRKLITLETHPVPHFCPSCGYRMHSRGIKTRTVHHPILQDGYELILLLKQRRWRCTNPDCRFENNDEFRFVNQRRRHSGLSYRGSY